jgi:hypothetical protein
VLIIGAVFYLLSQRPKQTIEEQDKLIKALGGRIDELEKAREEDRRSHIENLKAIADLQGQIKVYKELPLQEMATAMADISLGNKTIARSNDEILRTLQKSAVIAADDRDFLTGPSSQTIEEQTVVHQTVKNKGKR